MELGNLNKVTQLLSVWVYLVLSPGSLGPEPILITFILQFTKGEITFFSNLSAVSGDTKW